MAIRIRLESGLKTRGFRIVTRALSYTHIAFFCKTPSNKSCHRQARFLPTRSRHFSSIPVVSEWWEFATVADASEFVPVRYHPSSSTSLTATVIRGIDFVKPLKVVFYMHNVFPAFRRVCGFPQFTILRLQPCPSRRSRCRHFHYTLDIKSPPPVSMENGFLQLGAYQEHQEEIGGVLQALHCSL